MLPTQISPNLLGIHYVAIAVSVGVGAVPTLYMAGEFFVIGNGAELTGLKNLTGRRVRGLAWEGSVLLWQPQGSGS